MDLKDGSFWTLLNIYESYLYEYAFLRVGVTSSLCPRFAGECDPQSRDLTQLSSGYNFTTNHPSSSCWMHTWDNVAEKSHSKWGTFLCLSLTPSAPRAIPLPNRPHHPLKILIEIVTFEFPQILRSQLYTITITHVNYVFSTLFQINNASFFCKNCVTYM